MWKAILTGSRAYGTPRPDSDVDIAVRMSSEDVEILLKAIKPAKVRHHKENDSVSLWFDNLNLICITSDTFFETWVKGTEFLQAKAPVTREAAIEEFNKRGIAKCFESQDPSDQAAVVPIVQKQEVGSEFPF